MPRDNAIASGGSHREPSSFPRVSMKRGGRPTVILVHEHAGVLELVEAALRDRGTRVHATLDPFEALEVVRRLKVDLLVTSRERAHTTSGSRQVPGIRRGRLAALAAQHWFAGTSGRFRRPD